LAGNPFDFTGRVALIAFLAEGASYITGQSLVVDCGNIVGAHGIKLYGGIETE
jgi:NAD(P)-dependent dehydrogenase (short-subunit alcohol dehydrogenase family)